jgi:hypothetical protein
VYSIIDRGTSSAGSQVLQVGGLPGRRVYMVFNVPKRISDSTTIVRAELLLTQEASPAATARDTAFLELLVPTTSEVVSDIRRLLDLALPGGVLGIAPSKVIPSRSGEYSLNVLSIVKAWRLLQPSVPRAIGLRLTNEGSTPFDVRFSASESTTQPRPRLRITYLPRTEFALP